jgi:hypothetical protein
MYFSTISSFSGTPAELVGVNIDTKEEVWYTTCDNEPGEFSYPLLINDDVLYYLGSEIRAYNLKTKELLYVKTFPNDTPPEKRYSPTDNYGYVYYKGKLYYTKNVAPTSDNEKYKNIFCIDAKTGNLEWSDVAKFSESLGTIPIIAHDRMYVAQSSGLRVYNTNTGKQVGVDTTFCGSGIGMSHSVLYNDYMITFKYDRDTGVADLVAIDVGK